MVLHDVGSGFGDHDGGRGAQHDGRHDDAERQLPAAVPSRAGARGRRAAGSARPRHSEQSTPASPHSATAAAAGGHGGVPRLRRTDRYPAEPGRLAVVLDVHLVIVGRLSAPGLSHVSRLSPPTSLNLDCK